MATHDAMMLGREHVGHRFRTARDAMRESRSAFEVAAASHQGVQPPVQDGASIGRRNERCRIGENSGGDLCRQLFPDGQDNLTGQLGEMRDDARRVCHLYRFHDSTIAQMFEWR